MRHRGVAGIDALGQRFLQRLDRIFEVQVAERRGDLQGARRHLVHRMAARAVGGDEIPAPLFGRRQRQRRTGQSERYGQAAEKLSHHMPYEVGPYEKPLSAESARSSMASAKIVQSDRCLLLQTSASASRSASCAVGASTVVMLWQVSRSCPESSHSFLMYLISKMGISVFPERSAARDFRRTDHAAADMTMAAIRIVATLCEISCTLV